MDSGSGIDVWGTGEGSEIGTRQAFFDLLDAQQGVLVPGFNAFDAVLVEDIGDDVDSMLQVIESEDGGKIHHLVIIQSQIILGCRWKFFKLADDIVGKIPDAAAEEWRQIRYRHRLEAAGYLPELVESSRFLADNLALALDRYGIPFPAHHHKGIPADEGIPRQALASFNALQQKDSAAAVGDAQECGGRSEKVSENILADRNNGSFLGNSFYFVQRWLNHVVLSAPIKNKKAVNASSRSRLPHPYRFYDQGTGGQPTRAYVVVHHQRQFLI